MSAPGSSDGGNRTVFKPSPLKALKNASAEAASSPPPPIATPNEVTAVPLANAQPAARSHDDLTTFDPAMALPPVSPPSPALAAAVEAPGTAAVEPGEDRRSGAVGGNWGLWILAAIVVLILVALALDLPGLL